jgi:hypothetical protein
MLTVKDSLIDASLSKASEEVSQVSLERKFANFVFTSGWFVKKKLFGGFEGYRAIDVCWTYPTRTKQYVNFVPTINHWDILCVLTSGKSMRLSGNETTQAKDNLIPANSDYILRLLQQVIPWSIFGYSLYLNECWKKHRELFLHVHDKRVELIRNGIQRGDLVVQSNGALTTLAPSFTFPTIGMRFERNSNGKIERVYFEKT